MGAATSTRSSSAAISNSWRTTNRAAATGPASSRSTATPRTRSTRNYTYANALLGVFSEYTESSRPGDTFNRGMPLGMVRAGHVEADRQADHRLRRPLPVVHAVVAARQRRRELPAGSLRPGAGAGAVPAGRRQRPAPRAATRSPASWWPKCSSARSCRARAIRRTAWKSPASPGVTARVPQDARARDRAAPRVRLRRDRRRQDGAARERRALPQLAARRRIARQPAQPAVHHQSDPLLRDDEHRCCSRARSSRTGR